MHTTSLSKSGVLILLHLIHTHRSSFSDIGRRLTVLSVCRRYCIWNDLRLSFGIFFFVVVAVLFSLSSQTEWNECLFELRNCTNALHLFVFYSFILFLDRHNAFSLVVVCILKYVQSYCVIILRIFLCSSRFAICFFFLLAICLVRCCANNEHCFEGYVRRHILNLPYSECASISMSSPKKTRPRQFLAFFCWRFIKYGH